jgi:hypothetical protein
MNESVLLKQINFLRSCMSIMKRIVMKLLITMPLWICFTSVTKSQCPVTNISAPPYYQYSNYVLYQLTPAVPLQTLYCVEYGAPGFIPGNDTVAGMGGTVVVNTFLGGNQTLSGLTPSTRYEMYIRVYCPGQGWSANGNPVKVNTAFDFTTAVTLTTFNQFTFTNPSGLGVFDNYNGLGQEIVYKFVPPVTGQYRMVMTRPQQPGNIYYIYIKQINSVQDYHLGYWTYVTSVLYGSPTQNFQLFNSLTAGGEYYIIIDRWNSNGLYSQPGDTLIARIDGPLGCAPTSVSVTFSNLNSYSFDVDISYSGNNLSGFKVVEIGPRGFFPGYNILNGIGSVNQEYGTQNSFTFTNLAGGSFYDVYVRFECAGAPYYSVNSGPYTVNIPSCPPIFPVTTPALLTYFNPVNRFNYYNFCGSDSFPGPEFRFGFSCPDNGYYYIRAINLNPNAKLKFMYKSYNQICNPDFYTCLLPIATGSFTMYRYLQKGIYYDFWYDTNEILYDNVSFQINCPYPQNIIPVEIAPDHITFNWNGTYCHDTVFIEYGPSGFTPGTGYYSNGGILEFALNSMGSHTIQGLTPYTSYDFYFRTSCGGWFSNPEPPVTYRTAALCDTASVINCGTIVLCNNISSENVWSMPHCVQPTLINSKPERVYRFIPDSSGIYSINIHSISYQNRVSFYFKPDTMQCSNLGFSCIGSVTQTGSGQLSFGPLDSGRTYILLVEMNPYLGNTGWINISINCLSVCPLFQLSSVYDITPSSAFIGAILPPGQIYCIEYGPSGFIPSTDSTASILGTVVFTNSFPLFLDSLQQGQTYDVYLRTYCPSSGGFTNNSVPLSFTTCSAPASQVLTSGNVSSICQGDSVLIYQSGGQLVFNGQYVWYAGNCGDSLSVVGTGDSIWVSPASTTTFYLRAEAPCGNTSCLSKTITVNNNPAAAITGDTDGCMGDTITLTALPITASCIWSNGSTTHSISVDTTGVYTATLTDATGCQTIVSHTVTFHPLPTLSISGNNGFCQGDSTTLITAAGFQNYLWSTGDTTFFISITTPGTYSITVVDSNGCTATDSVSVIEYQPPSAVISPIGPVFICQGQSAYLSASTSSGYSYQWYKNAVPIVGANTNFYNATTNGLYSFTVSDTNGCQNTSASVLVLIVCYPPLDPELKLSTDHENDFMVIPNPANEIITVVGPNDELSRLFMYDFAGKTIFRFEEITLPLSVEISKLSPGIYILDYQTTSGRWFKKLVKKNE